MSSVLFDPAREGFLDGTVQWNATPAHRAALVRGYTFSAAHKFVSDATGAGATLVATAVLASKTAANGVADAADSVFTAVTTGAACTVILIYQSSAVTGGADVAATAQRLICFIDTATNLPVTPNGGDINVAYDNGANRIFKL